MSNIQAEITAINAQFDQAFNSKNAADIVKLYDANATVMPAPAGTPVIGTEAIQAFFAGLIDAGVIDPTKVTRISLENAASIASMLLTTECVISDKKEAAPAMPMPGGMGGGMDY